MVAPFSIHAGLRLASIGFHSVHYMRLLSDSVTEDCQHVDRGLINSVSQRRTLDLLQHDASQDTRVCSCSDACRDVMRPGLP